MIPFHPCGMVMDYARHCYTGTMMFWRDDPKAVKVRWFRAEPDAKLYPVRHLYWSRKTWNREVENKGLGERTDLPRRYDKGANPLGYAGLEHCGRDEAAQTGGVAGVDEEILTDPDGYPACCGEKLPPGRGLVVGGGAVFYAVRPALAGPSLVVWGEAIWPAPAYLVKAKAWHAVRVDYGEATHATRDGAKRWEGSHATEPDHHATRDGGKLWLGVYWEEVPYDATRLGGKLWTGYLTTGDGDLARLDKAKDFGAAVSTPSPEAAGLQKAKDFGAVVASPAPSVVGVEKGKQLVASYTF